MFSKQHRHPVVHFGDVFVQFSDYHRAGLERLAHFGVFPFVPQTCDRKRRRSISRREVPRLLPAWPIFPLVIAGYRNEATLPLECTSEERLCRYRFGSGIKCGELQFLERLTPPLRNQTPTCGDQLAFAIFGNDRVNGRGWADVVVRPEIMRRRLQGEPVHPNDPFPCQLVGGAPAHARPIYLLNSPQLQAP